jgi:hypothetical protein
VFITRPESCFLASTVYFSLFGCGFHPIATSR